MTWRKAFLRQAETDYLLFCELNEHKKPLCHQLHYLQMATEKLAKAFTCGPNNNPPKASHPALVRFLQISKGRPDLRRDLGFQNNSTFRAYIDSLLPLAEKIENLVPEGNHLNKPNSEYPWSNGHVLSPLDYNFKTICGNVPNMNKFKTLIANLIRIGNRTNA